MKKKFVAAGAAAALAIGLPLSLAVPASADPSSDTTKLCEAAPRGCEVSFPHGVNTEGVVEGEAVPVLIEGTPNVTMDFAVFHIDYDDKGNPTGMTRISDPVSVTLDDQGYAPEGTEIPTKPLEAPMTGGIIAAESAKFVVATADATDPDNLVGSQTGQYPSFPIRSARPMVTKWSEPREGEAYKPGELITADLNGGITGQEFQVQLKHEGEWVNVTYQGSETMMDTGTLPLSFMYENGQFPEGEYPMRIVNVTADETIYETTFTISADPEAPEPEPSETAKPEPEPSETAKPKPEPSETAKPEPSETAKPKPEPSETAKPEPSETPKPETPEIDPTAVHAFEMNGDCSPSDPNAKFEAGKAYIFTACNAFGEPLANTSVDIYTTADGNLDNLQNGTLVETITTDADGNFSITIPSEGYIGAISGEARFIIGDSPMGGGDQGSDADGKDKPGKDKPGKDVGRTEGSKKPGKSLPKTGV